MVSSHKARCLCATLVFLADAVSKAIKLPLAGMQLACTVATMSGRESVQSLALPFAIAVSPSPPCGILESSDTSSYRCYIRVVHPPVQLSVVLMVSSAKVIALMEGADIWKHLTARLFAMSSAVPWDLRDAGQGLSAVLRPGLS
jgi:hypothetical protein